MLPLAVGVPVPALRGDRCEPNPAAEDGDVMGGKGSTVVAPARVTAVCSFGTGCNARGIGIDCGI